MNVYEVGTTIRQQMNRDKSVARHRPDRDMLYVKEYQVGFA